MALGVAMLLWVLVPLIIPQGDATGDAPVAQPPLTPPLSSTDGLETPKADDAPEDETPADDTVTVDAQVQAGLARLGGPLASTGLGGSGGVQGLPRHELTLTISSAAPLGTVGYIIPTSLNDNYGVVKNVGRTFSVSTVVYGNPDYAQGFAQADARGNPVTCTVTVDGRVTERRSTEGPYAALFCQG